MAIGPSIHVTSKTTIDQMKTFMDQTKSGDRILAKTDKTTNTTILYVGKNSVMRDAVPGKTARRKERAKETLQKVIEQDFEKLKPRSTRVSQKSCGKRLITAFAAKF